MLIVTQNAILISCSGLLSPPPPPQFLSLVNKREPFSLSNWVIKSFLIFVSGTLKHSL